MEQLFNHVSSSNTLRLDNGSTIIRNDQWPPNRLQRPLKIVSLSTRVRLSTTSQACFCLHLLLEVSNDLVFHPTSYSTKQSSQPSHLLKSHPKSYPLRRIECHSSPKLQRPEKQYTRDCAKAAQHFHFRDLPRLVKHSILLIYSGTRLKVVLSNYVAQLVRPQARPGPAHLRSPPRRVARAGQAMQIPPRECNEAVM